MNIFGTLEWAVSNVNFIDGCSHDCKYCYSKEMAIRFKRRTIENWHVETIREKDFKKKYFMSDGRVMFPSSHDISPEFLLQSINILKRLLDVGNNVLIVTKPHFKCIKEICNSFLEQKEQITFRFTIGSKNSETLKFWEPGAPSFEERLDSLKYAYENGFNTSISCEPMLDKEISLLIEKVLPYVTDSIWLGKANYLLKRLKTNGHTDKLTLLRASELELWQNDKGFLYDLYDIYKDHCKIKWKESLKKEFNIKIPEKIGLDI